MAPRNTLSSIMRGWENIRDDRAVPYAQRLEDLASASSSNMEKADGSP